MHLEAICTKHISTHGNIEFLSFVILYIYSNTKLIMTTLNRLFVCNIKKFCSDALQSAYFVHQFYLQTRSYLSILIKMI